MKKVYKQVGGYLITMLGMFTFVIFLPIMTLKVRNHIKIQLTVYS